MTSVRRSATSFTCTLTHAQRHLPHIQNTGQWPLFHLHNSGQWCFFHLKIRCQWHFSHLQNTGQWRFTHLQNTRQWHFSHLQNTAQWHFSDQQNTSKWRLFTATKHISVTFFPATKHVSMKLPPTKHRSVTSSTYAIQVNDVLSTSDQLHLWHVHNKVTRPVGAAILCLAVCRWRHEQSRHAWQKCVLLYEPSSSALHR